MKKALLVLGVSAPVALLGAVVQDMTELKAQSLANAKQASVGILLYTMDFDDVFPYPQSTKTLQYVVGPYVKNPSVWLTKNPAGSSFRFNMAIAGVTGPAIPQPAKTLMLYEDKAWSDGTRTVSYADGHAKRIDAATWKREKSTLGLKLRRQAKPLPKNFGF